MEWRHPLERFIGNRGDYGPDGNYTVSALNDNVRTFNRTGNAIWNRITGSPFRAVAVSGDGSLVIAADDSGFLRTWTVDGQSRGVYNETDQVKHIVISPSQSLVAVSPKDSLKVFSPELNLIWKRKVLETVILLSHSLRIVLP